MTIKLSRRRTISRRRMRQRLAFTAAVALSLPALTCASAETAEEFYRGKTITMLIASGSGGGYDAYARAFARYVVKYIPGSPAIVPKNLPGAGGLITGNNLYNVAPHDGLTIGALTNQIAMDPLLGNKAAKFDAQKFGWIGSIGKQENVCVSWKGGPITSIDQAKQRQIVVGGASASSNSAVIPAMVNDLIGTKFKIVTGYKEGTGMTLALESGEVEAICGLSWSTLKARNPEWVRDDKLNVILQVGMKKIPGLETVPSLIDLMTNPDKKRALKLALVRQEMGRPFATPPETPDDRVAALRMAFDKTMKDPDFLAESKKLLLEIDPLKGEEIEALLKEAYAAPPAIVEEATQLLSPRK
jgi:tripartite-type tricarboxylate transporter receptor subunit TctC